MPEPEATSPLSPWLLVGLGNPGPRYAATPHNLGFRVIELLARESGIGLDRQTFAARWGQGWVEGIPVILVQPTTYMNLSGRAVAQFLRHFRLAPDRLVLIHDDLDVPAGRLKITRGGGAGGHRGVRSVLEVLDGGVCYRIKLGIGRPPPQMSAEEFVLSPIPPEQEEAVARLVARAAGAVVTLITRGLAAAQQQYHGPDNICQTREGCR